MKERDIERYLCARVKQLGGEVRKVKWIGRNGAPDRLVMLPPYRNGGIATAFAELKNPDTIKTFPSDARERAQAREHERMRRMGQTVLVIGTTEAIDEWLGVGE
jgi:CelD/BcsL family acetyltransferase involved in cellulose biosynthesis